MAITRIRRYHANLIRESLGAPIADPDTDPWAPVPDVVSLAGEHGVAAPDNQGWRRIGQHVGRSVARFHHPLVHAHREAPADWVQTMVRHVYPTLLGSSATIHVHDASAGALVVEFRDGLPTAYYQGLLEGVCEPLSKVPRWRTIGKARLEATWKATADHQGRVAFHDLWATRRLPLLTATVVPVVVALAIAAEAGPLHVGYAGATLLGVALFHLGSNAFNDYYDSVRPTTGTSSPHEAPTAQRMQRAAYVLFALAASVGLWLTASRGIEILWLGLAGFLLGILYSAPPVRLAHRGLGELAVAVGFGPIIVLGTYYVQRQTWSLEAVLASIPLAFLIAAVLYIREFPDSAGDARLGKRTLIVRLPERAAVVGYVLILALTYAVIVAGVALNAWPRAASYAFPPWSILAVATLPLAVRAAYDLAKNYRFPYRLVSANATTVSLHALTGLLFTAGYVVAAVP